MNIADQMKLIKDLKSNFDGLMKLQQEIVSQIPESVNFDKQAIQKDLSEIKRMAEKKDIEGLTTLSNKYASRNS